MTQQEARETLKLIHEATFVGLLPGNDAKRHLDLIINIISRKGKA
jgi:hypothetical protein